MSPSQESIQAQEGRPINVEFTPAKLKRLNSRLKQQPPQKILEWAIMTFSNLYQTTAFGLTGLAQLDMISKICRKKGVDHIVPLIFIDTLYHFDETLELSQRCVEKYNVPLLIYKPANCETSRDFEKAHGQRLWETKDDVYDYLVKVEPARRAYTELNVSAVITGRRRSQNGDRAAIPIVEVDSTGLIKVNPLAYWDFQRVWSYIKENDVPYNSLLDKGYKSIGDWHSTSPASDGTERSGRWEGKEKTECGLHKDYFAMRAAYLAAKKNNEQKQTLNESVEVLA